MYFKVLSQIFLLLFFCLDSYAVGFKQRTVDEHGQLVVQRLRAEDAPQNQASEYDSGATIDYPKYNGSGCGNGTASVTISPDHKTLSVLFDEFSSQTGSAVRDTKHCLLQLPIKVSPGYQVAIVKSDLRGFASLPQGATATFRMTHHLSAPSKGIETMIDKKSFVRETTILGPAEDDVFIGQHVESGVTWSPCGRDFKMNIQLGMVVTTNKQKDEALAVIDSIDFRSSQKGMKYHLYWRSCKS